MMSCFQMLLSNSTCASALWNESEPVTAWEGVTFGETGGADAGRVVNIFIPSQGKAVKVSVSHPITPTWEAPITKRLKLTYDIRLSIFAFKINFRRYMKGCLATCRRRSG